MANRMNRDKQTTSDPAEWKSCSEGELKRLGSRLTAKRRNERLSSAAHLGAWSLLLVAVGVFLGGLRMSDRSPIKIGGITCSECLAEISDYHDHLTGLQAMPETEAGQMQAHLAACEICRPKFEAMYPGMLEPSIAYDNLGQLNLAMSGKTSGKTYLPTIGLLATSY